MRDKCRPLLRSICACVYAQMSAWIHSPRTVIMGLVLLCFSYMNARSYANMLEVRGFEAHFGETLFWYLNTGFSMVMTSTFLLIMVSEIPKRIFYQNYMLIRVRRYKWLASQVVFCLIVSILMLVLITAFCMLLTVPYLVPGSGWSDLDRLAENPDYIYEMQLVNEYVRAIVPWKASIYAGSIVFLFWFTMLLVILMFSIFGHPNTGLLVYMFILQFALTFRFEMIPGMRTPIHYATMQAVANQFIGKELKSIPIVLFVYIAIDTFLVVIMMAHVRNEDLFFSGKE